MTGIEANGMSFKLMEVHLHHKASSSNPPIDEQLPNPFTFGLPFGISSFYGREEPLNTLQTIVQNILSNGSSNVTILSQLLVLSAMGGSGKTQTALKFISQFREFYPNVVWIEAETETTLTNSFRKLAKELKVSTINSRGLPEKVEKIVKNVYKKLSASGKPTLFVFDNADDFERGIGQFLPGTADPNHKNLVILVTSRNQELKLNNEEVRILPLELFTVEESFSFLVQELGIPDSPEAREKAREFIELLGGLPLALQQAVAYIKKENKLTGNEKQISDYTETYKSAKNEILQYDKIPGRPLTLFVTFNVTIQKIMTVEYGQSAIEIITVLALFYADCIPVAFIQSLFPKFKEFEIFRSLDLLAKYSLIKKENWKDLDSQFVTIHRQLQFVIVQNLQNSKSPIYSVCEMFQVVFEAVSFAKNIPSVLDYLMDKCTILLENINLSKCDDIIMNINQLIQNLSPHTDKSLEFMQEFAKVLYDSGRYSESLNLYTNVYNNFRDRLGDKHKETINVQLRRTAGLTVLGQYEEASKMCQDVLDRVTVDLGPKHKSTLAAKFEMAKVLHHQGQSSEESLKELLEQLREVLGEIHESTLEIKNLLAILYKDQENFAAALEIYEKIETMEEQIFGADDPRIFITKRNRATIFFLSGDVEEASKLFSRVYERQKEILGENHPDAIATLEWMAFTAANEGRLQDALEMETTVLERRKKVLGEDHPRTREAEKGVTMWHEMLADANQV